MNYRTTEVNCAGGLHGSLGGFSSTRLASTNLCQLKDHLRLGYQLLISPDCVFDASLVPGTCPGRFLDLKGLINKFLESRRNIKVRPWWSRVLSASSTAPEEERPL